MKAETREPLPVELLVDADKRRLAEAVAATKPIPASELEWRERLLEELKQEGSEQ